LSFSGGHSDASPRAGGDGGGGPCGTGGGGAGDVSGAVPVTPPPSERDGDGGRRGPGTGGGDGGAVVAVYVDRMSSAVPVRCDTVG